MAHPKRKISKTRRDKRRTTTKLRISKLRLALQLESTFIPQSALARGKLYYR